MVTVRSMQIEDYDQVYALWMTIHGFSIRTIDDSREGVERFLKRNPGISVVAEMDGRVVGAILCGHDGRRGCLYHVCVHEDYRMHGIGRAMVVHCMNAVSYTHLDVYKRQLHVWGNSVRALSDTGGDCRSL